MVLSSIYYTRKCQQCPKSVILDGSCGTVFPVYSLLMNGWEDPTFENRCLELPANQCRRRKRTRIQSLSGKDPLEEGMATHSSILAWRIPWTEEPGGLLSMGSERVGHDWSDLAQAHNLSWSLDSLFIGWLLYIKTNFKTLYHLLAYFTLYNRLQFHPPH